MEVIAQTEAVVGVIEGVQVETGGVVALIRVVGVVLTASWNAFRQFRDPPLTYPAWILLGLSLLAAPGSTSEICLMILLRKT